jgi:nitroreductase
MSDILELVRKRTSSRMPFDLERPVAEEQLAGILEAARWSPTAHNMQNFEIVVVDDRKVLEAIGSIERPISETFVRENYQQLSFSEEELLERKTGILATMFPPSWRNPDFRLDEIDDEEIASMQTPLPTSAVLLVVVYDPRRRAPASEGDFLGILSLGCVMENMWLAAESMGIGLQIVSSLSSGVEVKRILGIPDDLIIAFSCRLGYPASKPAEYLRVRRDVKDFTHHNRFGD